MIPARRTLVALLASAPALAFASCMVRFDSGPRGTAGADAAPTDGGATDGSLLADVSLPPPPTTCKKDGLACVPAAPAGWLGPFSLYDGASSSSPGCSNGLTQVLRAYRDLVPPPPAACAACACAPATGFTCGTIRIVGNSPACDCAAGSTDDIAANGCKRIDPGNFLCDGFAATGITVRTSPATGGQCAPTPSRPTPTKSPITWSGTAVACQLSVPSQVDCASGNVCAAVGAPPFGPKPCIAQSGDVPLCPGFPYSKRFLFYAGADDQRDCDVCTCGAAPSATCTTMAKTTDAQDCTGGTFAAAPICLQTDTKPFLVTMATPPTDVTCAASGGAPNGQVTPADPVTVCCAE